MALKLRVNGKQGKWDSDLILPSDVSNATVRITLRLALRPYEESSFELRNRDTKTGQVIAGSSTTYKTRPWIEREWIHFRTGVKQLCELHWNNVFWLSPPIDYEQINVPFYSPANSNPYIVNKLAFA